MQHKLSVRQVLINFLQVVIIILVNNLYNATLLFQDKVVESQISAAAFSSSVSATIVGSFKFIQSDPICGK